MCVLKSTGIGDKEDFVVAFFDFINNVTYLKIHYLLDQVAFSWLNYILNLLDFECNWICNSSLLNVTPCVLNRNDRLWLQHFTEASKCCRIPKILLCNKVKLFILWRSVNYSVLFTIYWDLSLFYWMSSQDHKTNVREVFLLLTVVLHMPYSMHNSVARK